MELELKVSHHRDLLQGNPTQYNRVAASVIQDLLGPEYDIMKMTTAEMYYYFFMAKANTLGPIWKFPWECAHTLMKDGLETKCGHKNIAAYDLSKMKPTPMAAGYVAPKRKLRLTTVGKINTAGEDRDIDIWLEPLLLQAEFDILDSYLNDGVTAEDIYKKHLYDLTIKRVMASITSDDHLFNNASLEDRKLLVDLGSMTLIANLLKDIKVYDNVGYALEFLGRCDGCKREVTLRLPFLAGIVVYS